MPTKSCAEYHINPPLGSDNRCLLCRRAKRDKAAQQAYNARSDVRARINARLRSKYVPHPRPPLTEAEQQQRAERQEQARQRKRLADNLRYRAKHPKSIFCKHGHVVVKRTKCGSCWDCAKEKNRRRNKAMRTTPEGRAKERQRRLRQARKRGVKPQVRLTPEQRREKRRTDRRHWKLKRRGVPGKHTVVELRARYAEQEGRCFWCREALSDDYHRDHVIPVSKGGTNDIRNIVLACAPCNVRKSDTHPLELLLA